MTDTIFNSPKIRLRAVGLAEGISYLLLLFIAVPLKRLGGHPEAVELIGPIHGLLFVLYMLTILQAKTEYNWPLGKTILASLASIIPCGTFFADHKNLSESARPNNPAIIRRAYSNAKSQTDGLAFGAYNGN